MVVQWIYCGVGILLMVLLCGLRPDWFYHWWDRIPEHWQMIIGVGTLLTFLVGGLVLTGEVEMAWWKIPLLGYILNPYVLIMAVIYPFVLQKMEVPRWRKVVSWGVWIPSVLAWVALFLVVMSSF